MEKSGADVESRPWLRVFGKFACGECLGNQRSRCLLQEGIGGGMRWRGGQGYGLSYQGRDSYMHLQRIHPTVIINFFP